ncbi:MAG: amidophosphoribosyltransferase [Spirochaetales bacterium]|nr:MAG: amidophosphoribosyltransferase [Spirochaetales bacterium]
MASSGTCLSVSNVRNVTVDEPSLRHHCGVAGIYSRQQLNIPELLFFPLFALQHRGQESAGIAYRKSRRTVVYKDLGMVSTVLSRYLTEKRSSNVGIGHVRYSTHGGNKVENVQPIHVSCNKGEIAVAHNGNISNTPQLKEMLFQEGSIFQTTSDTELLLHLISRSRAPSFYEALMETLQMVEGAFSMVMMHDDSLVAVRDSRGFRPLYIGWKGDMTVIASETCALDIMKIEKYRSVEPGEVIVIDQHGERSDFLPRENAIRQCVFELIYFARPDSKVFDISVHDSRKRMGAALALADSPDIGDIVVPVPDSGIGAALGYAEQSGIPFDMGLTRNHYAGRSFIMPTTSERELAVRMKLHPVREVIRGKRVILVDDSLVRGTTAKILVKLIREAGAREIHLRLSSPEIRWPCFFGIDIPPRKELISNSLAPAEIADLIAADSVSFLDIELLENTLTNPQDFCFACFNGRYPVRVPLSQEELSADLRRGDLPQESDLVSLAPETHQ